MTIEQFNPPVEEDPSIIASHGSGIGRHSPEVVGRGLGLLLNHLNLCQLHVTALTLKPAEVSVVLFQEEVLKAAEGLHIYDPSIPLQRWADHFLAIAVTTTERQLALETVPLPAEPTI
jgi:hypothetical protein